MKSATIVVKVFATNSAKNLYSKTVKTVDSVVLTIKYRNAWDKRFYRLAVQISDWNGRAKFFGSFSQSFSIKNLFFLLPLKTIVCGPKVSIFNTFGGEILSNLIQFNICASLGKRNVFLLFMNRVECPK
jgi:hypothetical protein